MSSAFSFDYKFSKRDEVSDYHADYKENGTIAIAGKK
jgi:hypothetical protein